MQNLDILSFGGLRLDGRRSQDLRSIQHNFSCVVGADGSVYLEQGLNKVTVAVHGPQEPTRRISEQLMHDNCSIVCRVSYMPCSGSEWKQRKAGDRKTLETENILRGIAEEIVVLDAHPRTELSIIVHVFETDGSILCTIVNAMCMALMDAGVPMYDMVFGCTVGCVQQRPPGQGSAVSTVSAASSGTGRVPAGGSINNAEEEEAFCVDLTQLEQNLGVSCMPVVMKGHSEEIIYMQLDSRIASLDLLNEAMITAIEGCRRLKSYIEAAMRRHGRHGKR
mmetsp:Transcript_7581/g.12592  ORF Transcript_7581/g.12592 Transcript_7581/m.12592 type:complete len:279 (+) Transcript_7581:444-1280(+)|eukprot:CAMPEP_0174960348 /NCGR_PEP_ID=MMETSP0004_2-20121128/3657_1 /TAXON_ID=420556 /ORGANISM="Ochromonas sp., Strain CCMP1393" /LENGTH=278 /DNA_ID=CAMNT_0016208717 /DNA_START=338 /DNA_END=1174 /DNA_ORIENTATION=-